MHYIRLVVLGDSQVGKTSLIKQLVGEELRFEPQLECEAQIEAVRTRLETTWLSELGDHEDKLEQAITIKRLASLLASQIELQQLLLKQQQQGNKARVKAPAAGSTKENQSSSSSTRHQKDGAKYLPNSSNSQQSDSASIRRFDHPAAAETECLQQQQHQVSPHISSPQQNTPTHHDTSGKSKCESRLSGTVAKPNHHQGPHSDNATKGRGSMGALAPNSLTSSSHQATSQLTYHEPPQQQLERPTILISSSSLASSSTTLCEHENDSSTRIQQSVVCEKLGQFQAQAAGVQTDQSIEKTSNDSAGASAEKELIENTCSPSYNPARNQQFNDGPDQNRTDQESSVDNLESDGQQSDKNKPPPTINQPLDHNRVLAGPLALQEQKKLPASIGGRELMVAANETSTGNANHVPDGEDPQKQHSKSDKGGAGVVGQTTNVVVDARQRNSLSEESGLTACQPHKSTSRHEATSSVQSLTNHDQLRPMRSLGVAGERESGAAISSPGRCIINNGGGGKDDGARDVVVAQPHHHQHRHSYCAPTSVSGPQKSTTTTSAAGGRFGATKDELGAQAKIINILFSNNNKSTAAAAAAAASSSQSNHDAKSSAQETAPSGNNRPLLMPALLRQYQRRLSNFHSHNSSNHNHHHHHHQRQQSEHDISADQSQSLLRGGALPGRESPMAWAMAELMVAEQKRRAQLVREAACAAGSLATSAAAAAQALLVARSPIISANQLKTTTLAEQRRRSQLDLQDSLASTRVPEENHRGLALESKVALPIFDGYQPSSWVRGSDPLDGRAICHEANLYALTEEFRLKLATYNSSQAQGIAPEVGSSEISRVHKTGGLQDNELSTLVKLQAALKIRRPLTIAHKYDIKHFCANYIDNMNLYEIKIVDMPTIEPVSEFPTSSLVEWSLFKGRSHLLTADAYLLVFDLTRPSTIQYIKTLRDKIFESREMSNVPVYVIANKADLCPTLQPSLQARQMRNVVVQRHQATLNGGGALAPSGTDVDANGQSSLRSGQQAGGVRKAHAQDQRNKSKWSLKSHSFTKSPVAATPMPPPPPTTFNLSSEQRSVPAAAAHQLLAAYKMHRMRLGGTGPIVSLRRWAKLRSAVALHEPQYYGASGGSGGGPMSGASYLNPNSAWCRFERKRTNYSLIVGASGGVDSRAAGALHGPGRFNSALGRVRTCLRTSWSLLTRGRRPSSNSRRRDNQAIKLRARRRTRPKFATAKSRQVSASSKRKRSKSRTARIRDHTESALIKGAKRRKSSIFVGTFNWNHGDGDDGSPDEHDSKKKAQSSSRLKSIGSAATRRSNWSNLLHLSAPSDMTQHTRARGGQRTDAAHSAPADRSPSGKVSKLMATTWRASGQRLGLKRKRTSGSSASVGSEGSNSRGILKTSKRYQETSASAPLGRSLDVDRLDVDGQTTQLGSASTMDQRDSNTDSTAPGVKSVTLHQSGITMAPEVLAKRRLVEPLCGAMSTPASRQTFYDLFNRLLQTSSTTAAKTQLKRLGASDGQSKAAARNDTRAASAGAQQLRNSRADAGANNSLTISQDGQQSSDKKSKRRKSSSTGAALWQTISSLALSRISQSGDRKNSGSALEKVATSITGSGDNNHATQRSASVLGGRLSVTSRASGCSISGLTIFEDPQQQREADARATGRREVAQSSLLANDGLKLGTDQYLSVDMLRKLSLISSSSQISPNEETAHNDQGARDEQPEGVDATKRPKSAPSEPAGVAEVLRRASRVWLGNKSERNHKRHHQEGEGCIIDGEGDTTTRPHTSEPEAGTGAKRLWYRGVVKKILFHSNRQSLKGIVTAMELQKRADEEARAASEQAEQAKMQQQPDSARQNLIIDVTQPKPSTSKLAEEKERDAQEDLAGGQQHRRQSLAVVQSAPSIRIIGSGSSMSLLSENNASGSGDVNRQSATPTKSSEFAHRPASSENMRLQESTQASNAKRTLSASSSAGSLASNSASLSESVSLDIDTNTNAAQNVASPEDADEPVAISDSGDLLPEGRATETGEARDDRSGSSSSNSAGSDDEESNMERADEPQVNYQLRKLSADDCLIINRHRRQSLAALKDEKALSALKNRADIEKVTESGERTGPDETSGESEAAQQKSDDKSEERAATGEEGRRQSIKQSIEAAIHLLVPRAKARSASITLGASDCERRSRSQLGTAIMGAVNVHKTWRDWRQLLGRKKSANLNKDGIQGGDMCEKVVSNGTEPERGGPFFTTPFSGTLLGDSFNTSGAAAPPIVGFLSSHVAYKKLSVDQQREAAINLDQLMRINQLTLTAASVVMLAATQPPPARPFGSSAQTSGSHVLGSKRHTHNNSHRHQRHHHQHHHKGGQSELPGTDPAGQEADMKDDNLNNVPGEFKSMTTSLNPDNHEVKKKSLKNRGGKNQQENPARDSAAGLQPLMTRLQSGGNSLLRNPSLGDSKTNRVKKRVAKAHDDNKHRSNESPRLDDMFGPLALIGPEMDPSQAADLVRAQSALGDESSSTAAAAAAAAAAASSQAPPAEGDISAQIAAAAASALERQRRRGEKLSSIIEPRYDKKQPGAEYPVFVSHDLNPILKDLAQLVRKHWKCNYIECSAASNWNVRPIISELTRALECNNRFSSSSSGISVDGDGSERGSHNRMHGNPSGSGDHFFGNECAHSDEFWSSGEEDFRPDDDDDSALTSQDESSSNFVSSDDSDKEEVESGANSDAIRNSGDGRRTTKGKRSAAHRGRDRRRKTAARATKCSIM